MTGAPGFWLHETSGVLRPAVEAYLRDQPMTDEQIAAMRAYLRQWMWAPWAMLHYRGDEIPALRVDIEKLTTRKQIAAWLGRALEQGIDPL